MSADELAPWEWLDGDHEEAIARAQAGLPAGLVGAEYVEALDAAYVTEALAIQALRRAERAAAEIRRQQDERAARRRTSQREARRGRYEWARQRLLDQGIEPTDGLVAKLLSEVAPQQGQGKVGTVSDRALRQWREAGDID